MMKPLGMIVFLLISSAGLRAQTVRVGAPAAETVGNAAAAVSSARSPSMALPASNLSLSLSASVQAVGRAPSPQGANAALDSMYMASKTKASPVLVAAQTYSPALEGPRLEPSAEKTPSARKDDVPAAAAPEAAGSATAAQAAVGAAVIAGLIGVFYLLAQAMTSLLVQWEAQLRAAQDIWSQLP